MNQEEMKDAFENKLSLNELLNRKYEEEQQIKEFVADVRRKDK